MKNYERAETPGQNEALHRATLEKTEYIQSLTETERQLSLARGRPLLTLTDFVLFRTLNFLATRVKIVPERMAARFAKSAAKRSPYRTARGLINESSSDTTPMPSVKSFVLSGKKSPKPSWPTILVVSHEAERTGAPIVALNLAQALAPRFNVVSLVLRKGAILESFRDVSTEVHVADRFHREGSGYSSLIKNLCRKHKFSFAIVNSIESRGVLQPLSIHKVPTVSLVHEFASYTRPKSAFTDVADWSSELVFSTHVTLENALLENPALTKHRFHVLPQGKCEVPNVPQSAAQRDAEQSWLRTSLGLGNGTPPPLLIIGAGQVQLRKGVDLFIEVATRVLKDKRSKNVRFAWIGNGYDPKRDLDYSVYLYDQLRRAGIADRVQILRATSEIEFVYQLADVFVLSSRLDPLPNVAIDALSSGLPVLCFDRATGIAEFLEIGGLARECVADYIDTSDMAQKLLAIISVDYMRDELSMRSKQIAESMFDFALYAKQIETLGLDAARKVAFDNRVSL
jgi:glycosyltransferase involved in cell wall biosynthesis